MWGYFKDGVLNVCDEVCGKKMGRRKGDTWWWNEDVKGTVSRKKDAHKAMCQNSIEENKRRYKSMKNKAKKAVSKTFREKAEEALTELQNCLYGMLRLVKGLKTDSKEVEGGRYMRGCDGRLCFSDKQRGKVWKDYVERIMDEVHYWDHNVEGDAVEAQVDCVSREDVLQALNKIKQEKRLDPQKYH